jgi:hypothetical protein
MSETEQTVKKVRELVETNLQRLERLEESLRKIKEMPPEW